jgi:hypothetical protein
MAALLQKRRWNSLPSPCLSGHIHMKGLIEWELLRCGGRLRVKTQETEGHLLLPHGCSIYIDAEIDLEARIGAIKTQQRCSCVTLSSQSVDH